MDTASTTRTLHNDTDSPPSSRSLKSWLRRLVMAPAAVFITNPKRLAAASVSTLLVASSFLVVEVSQAQDAQAATRCIDGSEQDAWFLHYRSQATTTIDSVLWEGPSGTANMQLRYNPTYRCAYAFVGATGYYPDISIHLDRTTDGGRTWQGLLGETVLRTTHPFGDNRTFIEYTGAFNDNSSDPYGTQVRACMNVIGAQFGCTRWY